MSAIFVSHSSRDDEVCGRVKAWLEEHGHRSVFLDFDPEHGIPPGRDWERELYQRLRACRAVVAVVSEHFTASRWCFAEITQARSLGKKIIPLKVDDGATDPVLADLQAIDLARGAEDAARRLARALEAAGVDAADPFDWDGSRSPYPGFPAFQEEDAAIFFGRGAEIGRGLDALHRARWQGGGELVMILGASGAGKSSLLRAGLLPRLRRDRREWIVAGPLIPGREPVRELAGALAGVFPQSSGGGGWRRIQERLEEAGDGIANPLVDLADDVRLTSSRQEARVLLVVDQFEELLGHPAGHPSERFLRLLRGAVEQADGPLMALVTMRSDFLGELQQHPVLRGLELTGLPLGPMPVESLAEVIEKPAALAGIDVEPGLTNALIHDAEGPGALPLVAFTLRELCDRWGGEGRLTAEQYRQRLGGLRGAVARVAESAMPKGAELKRVEGALRDAFLRMVRINEEGQYSRQPVAWEDLPASIHPLLERFVDARLLTSREEGPSRRLEVAHETLFSAWDTLAGWLREGREALLVRKEVQRAAATWQREDRAEEYLWSKGRLQRALELRGEGRLPLDAGEGAFLDRSREVERQGRRRRRLLVRGGVVAVAAVALAMAGLALIATSSRVEALREKREAEIQAAKALAIQSRTAGYPLDQALLLAVESGRRLQELGSPDLFESRTSLLNLLLSRPALDAILHGHADWVWSAAVSPDGRRAASGSSDGRLLVWDLEARRPLWNLDPCSGERRAAAAPGPLCALRVRSVAYSPDGSELAAGLQDGRLQLWEPDGGVLRRELVPGDGAVVALAYRADGRRLAIADGASVHLYERSPGATADGWATPPRLVGRHDSWLTKVAFLTGAPAVVSAGADKTVRRWDLDGEAGGRVLFTGDEVVYALAAGPGGSVAAGFGNGVLRTWDGDGALSAEVAAHDGEVRDLAFGRGGAVLASAGGFDGTLRLWRAGEGGERGLEMEAELAGHVRGAKAVAFGPAGGALLVGAAGDGQLLLWDLERSAPRMAESGHDSRLLSVAFGTGAAATGAVDGSVRLTRLDDWHEEQPIERQDNEIWGLALGADGVLLATSSGDVAVRLWDLATGRRMFERSDPGSWIWDVALAPGGGLLASADNAGTVRLWDVPSGIPRLLIRGEVDASGAMAVAFSPGGETLAVGRRDGTVELWHAATGQRLASWSGHGSEVSALAFEGGGSRLAAASVDGSLRLWAVSGAAEGADGSANGRAGQRVALSAVAFAPDGRQFATGDAEGVIRIWDAAGGTPRFALLGHQGEVLALAFESGGRLVSGGADRTLRRWEIGAVDTLETAYRRACRIANRELDDDEWRQFFHAPPERSTCPDPQRTGS